MSKISKFLVILQLIVFPAIALDLSSQNDVLSNMFLNNVDKNEGKTSFRSLNIPSGGRAESLGTAYTALADDINFFDYNPAASCTLKNTELYAAHNSWISDSSLETIAGTIRFKNLGLGAQIKCFYVPFTEYNMFGDRVAGNYYSETTATFNISYNFFAGYYFKGLALGTNFKTSWRSIPDYTDNETDAIIKGSGLAQSAAAIMADFGMLLRFNFAKFFDSRDPNAHIGLSIMNLGTAFTGFGSANGMQKDDPLPTRVSFGVSYQALPPITFTAEVRKPINLREFEKSEQISVGTGAIVKFTDFFSFLCGFLLQGANPRISAGSEFKVSSVLMNVNYTFDLTSSMNPINHISLSAKINLGDRGRQQTQDAIDAYYTDGLKYYANGDLDNAIEMWEKALQLDNGFDPARECIQAAQTSKDLYQYIMDIQSLD